MRALHREPKLANESLAQAIALGCLLVMGGLALFGPSGLMAWSENNRLLVQRQAEVAQLKLQNQELKNRVSLLDPGHVDADIAGELLRSNLNVVHEDEMVMLLD